MALSANQSTLLRDGRQFEYGVVANAAIYQGALVELSGGNVKKAEAGTGKQYRGIALEQVTGSATAGEVKVNVRRRVAAKFKTITTGRNTAPALGATAYVHDDETVTGVNDVAASGTVDRSELGEVVAVESDGVWVYIE